MNDPKPSLALRAVSLSLALALLGFSMFQAGGLGCSRPSEQPIAKEEATAAPGASSAPAVTIVSGTPTVEAPPSASDPETKPKTAPPKPAVATKPTSSEPPRYFPGTKAAPMPWAQQPQQKNPAPNQAVTPK